MPLSSLSAPRNYLNGRFAECAIGGVLLGVCFDWSVDLEYGTTSPVAFGDLWETPTVLTGRWRARAKGFVVSGSVNHYLKALFAQHALISGITFAGYSGSVASGTKIFE